MQVELVAVANPKRDWRIYAEFAQKVIAQGRRLYTDDVLGVYLDQTVYALDSTTIDAISATSNRFGSKRD